MKCAIQQGLLSLVIIAMLTSASLANSLVSSYEDNALDNQNRAAGFGQVRTPLVYWNPGSKGYYWDTELTDSAPTANKRAQSFVRFGKRAQSFVRFGRSGPMEKRAQTFVRLG